MFAKKEKETLNMEEVGALISYALNNIKLEGNALTSLSDLRKSYEDFKDVDDGTPSDELFERYAGLVSQTHPVNGKTLIDTKKMLQKLHVILLLLSTSAFLILAIGNELADIVITDLSESARERWFNWINFQEYIINPLTPFFWGGLGSCVYLLKRLHDFAVARDFDIEKAKGWGTRILLGSILGGIMQYIYDPSSFTDDVWNLDANAVAFLTGVGVYVMYGAIEKAVQKLEETLNLKTLHKKERPDAVEFLKYCLSKVDPIKEIEKYKLLKELLKEAEKPVKA